MKNKMSIRKGMAMMLGGLLSVSLLLGGGSVLKARAASANGSASTDDSTNMSLGVSDIVNPTTPTDSSAGFTGSYVYFGTNTYNDSKPALKFRVLQNETKLNSDPQNRLLLDCDEVLYTAQKGSVDSIIDTQLNGTKFWDNCLDTVQQNAVAKDSAHSKIFLLDNSIIMQSKYGYAKQSTGSDASSFDRLIANTLIKKKGDTASAYWLKNSESKKWWIKDDGGHSTNSDIAPDSAGVSPALYLDTSKVLFSERVNGAPQTNGEYKLTLLDSSLKLTNDTALSTGFDIDKDGKVTFPVTLEGADAKNVSIKVLVTNSTTGSGSSRTDTAPAGAIKYYSSNSAATYADGKVTFTYSSDWDNYYIFLVAVKRVGGKYTDTASTPLYLGEGHHLISSIEMEVTVPLSDTSSYINDAGSLPNASNAFTTDNVKIKKFNDTEINDDTSSPISIDKVTSDAGENAQIKFNTSYTLGFQIKKVNDTSNCYKFDENNLEVKIKYKQKDTDKDYTQVSIKALKDDGSKNEQISINNSASDNEIPLTVSGFTFTTRKARFINSDDAFTINPAANIPYAATYAKVQEYLKAGKEAYTTEVPIEGGGKIEVPVTWIENPHNTFSPNNTNGGTFSIQGTLTPSDDNLSNAEFPEGTPKDVVLSVNMEAQKQAGTPQITTADENITSNNQIKVGHRIKISASEALTWPDATIHYSVTGSNLKDNETNGTIPQSESKEIELKPDTKLSTIKVEAYASRGDDRDSDKDSQEYTFASHTLTAVDGTIEYNYGTPVTSSSDSESQESSDDTAASTTTTTSANVLWGATVTATAVDKTSEGKIFIGWKVYEVNGTTESDVTTSFSFTEGTSSSQSIKFEMPNEALKVVATYESVSEPTFATEGQPKPATVDDQAETKFSVTLTYPTDKYNESAFNYQWQSKASESANDSTYANIDGANSKEYSLTAAYADSGKVYRCVVTYTSVVDKQSKTLTSTAATLTVKQTSGKLNITKDLQSSVSVEEGKDVTLTVAATPGYTGNALSYQWYCASNTTDEGKAIENATNASYTISNATTENHNNKVYYCVVTEKQKGADGTETELESKSSAKATLTVSKQPVKESHNITVTDGKATVNGEEVTSAQEGTTITITADTKENKKFTGWSTTTTGVNFTDSTATTTTFTMPDSAVTITANYEDDYSISITKQPENVSIPVGQSATFTVEASCYPSEAELTYQWQEASGGSSTFKDMEGKTEATLKIESAAQSKNGNRYQCVISFKDSAHADVTVTSDPAMLSVEAALYTIKVNNGTASAATSKSGETITVKAQDAPEGQEFKKWTVVSGSASFADANATETTFTMPNKDVEVTAEFQTKLAAPTITKQPENVTVYAGASTSFQIEATGEELSYQWQVDKTDGKGFQNISGATNTSYRIYTEDGSMNGYKYKCVVSNRSASVESDTVTLTVNYKITEGAKSSWKKSSSSGLTFQGNGAYAKFRLVKVDGKLVSAGNYTKKSDPTIITLVASYLETLSTGDHTLTIVWEDGTAETTFTVSDSSSTSTSTSSSSSSKSSSSSSSSGSTSSSSTGSTTSDSSKSSTTSGKVSMPVVDRYEDKTSDSDSTKDAATEENGTEEEAEAEDGEAETIGENGSVITTLDGDLNEKPSKLNEYAAAASLAVIGLSIVGGGTAFLVRKKQQGKDDFDDFDE